MLRSGRFGGERARPATILMVAVMERSGEWFEQAERDLAHGRSDLVGRYYDWACFSAQQAADKAAKAVLYRAGNDAWGHSVADLLEAIRGLAHVSDELLEAGLELDKVYIPSRYPDAHPSGSPSRRYTRAEAERALNHAEQIVQHCQSLLATL
jgi:HEPN domain-containing protein